MSHIVVRNMESDDEYFVSTCSHVDESAETDACAQRRLAHLKGLVERGAKIKVAVVDGEHAGFAYLLPIEISPWGPIGENIDVMPCLWVTPKMQKKGAGRALVSSIIRESETRGRAAISTYAYYTDSWFMPAGFFEKHGFACAMRKGTCGILWKRFTENVSAPAFLDKRYRFQKVDGKVAVDLFYNDFCLTSCGEAERVREVSAEFGDRVVLREFSADDRRVFHEHRLPRAIFVNGREIGWGYEAPKEGIREAIRLAFDDI